MVIIQGGVNPPVGHGSKSAISSLQITNSETIIIHVGAMARRHGAGLKSELCSALPRP